MNPLQKNKIDLNSLSPDEQRLLRLYGKMPNKKDLLQNKLRERKYFDSGDYALSKAGKASDVGVTSIGSRHPLPENIPHLTATSPPQGNAIPGHFTGGSGFAHPGPHNGFPVGISRSPVKESSFLHRQTSVDDPDPRETRKADQEASRAADKDDGNIKDSEENLSVSPPQRREGLPIRR